MLTLTEQGKTEHLAAVRALVRAKVPADEQAAIERFVGEYYRQVDADDLAELEAADIYGAALSHLSFARRRDAGSPKVRVFNPSIEEHGWQSTHTVVEIVNDDMPFLVDSVTMEVNRHSLALHLIVHPVFLNRRDPAGQLVEAAATHDDAVRESFMHVQVDRIPDAAGMEALAGDLARVLNDVRFAVSDWRAMRACTEDIIGDLDRRPPPIGAEQVDEGKAFLRWLLSDHFTFLGYRLSNLTRIDGSDALQVTPGSGLGILRGRDDERPSASFAALPPEARAYARVKDLLLVTKSNSRSTVHRPGYLDYIGIKRYDDRGEVCGEHRFLGLYTHATYSVSPADIPLLRRKVANVIERAGFAPGGHAAKALEHVLETYPRDELFQIGEDELLANALGILHLGERQRLRLFVRRDGFERYCVCLIYAPREHYNTEVRRKWQALLTQAFNGVSSEFNVFLSESVLARILITVRTKPGKIPAYDVPELEARLVAASRRWGDDLRQALLDTFGEARGNHACRRFGAAFPAAYREDYPPRNAVPDIETMEQSLASGALGMNLYRPVEAPPGMLRFKLFHPGRPAVLSDSLPMLERMGLSVLEQRPYRITPEGAPPVWIEDLGLATRDGAEIEIDALRDNFEDTFARVFAGAVENDGFNRLVLAARLDADQIVVLRAYAKYLRQIAFPLSQSFIEATLAANPEVARMLVNLFRLRFDPEHANDEAAASQVRALEAALDRVENLNEDRVLRQYLALVLATLRTNHWRRDEKGARREFLSFKLDPSKVPGLPEPKPMFEIFVYSARFEGVHLRGGKVARGGLRWSDRPEDFRTEVLGLVKAQMVKNTVIVPVGSKGGFVLKKAPPAADREAFMKEGVGCYQNYLRGLLDLTDNFVGGQVIPPPQTRRHDPDDPYLVVAADKGTATFSDYANAISQEYGFWLADAFASGGSVGYDHKAMGITARGAWESVKAPLPRDGHRHPKRGLHRGRHRRHVGRRVRQRHAAVAAHPAGGGVRPPPRLSRSRPRRRDELRGARADVPAAALLLGRLQPRAYFQGRRCVAARREVGAPVARGAAGARHRSGGPEPERADRRHPEGAGGSALQRRHRHLREERGGEPCRCRRPHQRSGARRRPATALEGGGRGGQSRPDPARPGGIRPRGRAHLHRCDRQLGRRRHVRPRSQPQDFARSRGRGGRAHGKAAQHAARVDDRRGRAARAARQLLSDPGALRCRPPRAAVAGWRAAIHPVPREGRAVEACSRVSPGRRGDRSAAGTAARAREPRARSAAGIQQDLAVRRPARVECSR